MDDGKEYLKKFDAGATYSKIADKAGISRSAVAAKIYEYRKANNLPVSDRKKSHSAKQFLDPYRGDRIKALKECYVREDGVTQCPPKQCVGYGFSKSIFEGVL